MGVFGEIFEGVIHGMRAVAMYQSQMERQNGEPQVKRYNGSGNGGGRIQRLCGELGWRIDACTNGGIQLYFNGPGGDRRILLIQNGDGDLVSFAAFSSVMFDKRAAKLTEIMAYLLRRNMGEGGIGRWGAYMNDDGKVSFHVMYEAIGDGLNELSFKFVCESLVNEGSELDAMLREACLAR